LPRTLAAVSATALAAFPRRAVQLIRGRVMCLSRIFL
jgi:hypothetical protein